MKRARRATLVKSARKYAGELVRQVTYTYDAFSSLPPEEQDFIDEYLRTLGERLIDGGRG